ncbi:unnamed protein product [Alternaria alternata]
MPPPTVHEALTGVKEAISRLNKIGVLIRSSSKSTITARARRFASQYPKLVRLAEFEDQSYIALQFLYPNASRTLREQLVDSMGDRYAKLRYEAHRFKANYTSGASARDVQNAMQRDGIENAPGKVPDSQVSHSSNEEGDEAQEKNQTAHIVIPTSSIDTAGLPLNLEEAVSKSVRQSRAGKTLIENIGRLREPDLPSFQEGENITSCVWCHQVVDRSVLHATQKKWSEEGRRHYMRDLQPYICLSEDCRESRPSFASSFEWFNHMRSDHSDSWSSRMHNQPAWMCIAKHENDTVYSFSLKDELLNHIRVHQCKAWVCTGIHENDSTFAFSSRNALVHHILHDQCNGKDFSNSGDLEHPECLVQIVRKASSCPLCLFSMENQSSNNRNASHDDGEEGTVTSQAMASHIADHLHHVMTVSLQIVSIMQGSYDGYEGDVQSQSSGPSTALSDPDDEAMRKRFDDLPESVQGSMDWPEISEVSWKSGSDGAPLDDLPGHRDGSSELREQDFESSRFDTEYRMTPAVDASNQLDKFFANSSRRQERYTEPEIQKVSLLLQRLNPSWSTLPRIYVILRAIDCLGSLDTFIDLGISDYWFPFTERDVPSCIPPRKRLQYVAAQDLVRTDPINFECGLHSFFRNGDLTPLEIRGRINPGGTRWVCRVLSSRSGKEYAMKRADRFFRDSSWKELIDQISIMKDLRHRHVVKTVGSYSDPEFIGHIMSPVADMDLAAYLAKADEINHGELRTFFGCLARGLQFLHEKGILHEDIQPRNILVHQGNVLYTDIGQASCQYDKDGTMLARMSLRYGAPELANQQPASKSSDIWSLGVVFLEMAAVIRGVTVDYIYEFLLKHGMRQPHPRGNIPGIDVLIAELKKTGNLADDLSLECVKEMLVLGQELRPTASSLVKSLKRRDVNKAFVGTCCSDFIMEESSLVTFGDKKDRRDGEMRTISF